MRSQTRRAGRVVCQTTRLSSADSLSAAVVIRARHPGASFTPVTIYALGVVVLGAISGVKWLVGFGLENCDRACENRPIGLFLGLTIGEGMEEGRLNHGDTGSTGQRGMRGGEFGQDNGMDGICGGGKRRGEEKRRRGATTDGTDCADRDWREWEGRMDQDGLDGREGRLNHGAHSAA